MAIYKKGTTQAQKIKSIIIIIVMVALFSIPIYNIGKKLLSYIPEKKSSNASDAFITLSGIFKDAYDGGIFVDPSNEIYSVISKDASFTLDYNNKLLSGVKASVWNNNKIVAKWRRDLKGIIIVTTFTLYRNTGKLKQEVTGKYGTTTINFNCSKAKKKF